MGKKIWIICYLLPCDLLSRGGLCKKQGMILCLLVLVGVGVGIGVRVVGVDCEG